MLRFLSPLLILAFLKSHRQAIKRLALAVPAYVLLMLFFMDFQAEIFTEQPIWAKLFKWLILLMAVLHVLVLLKGIRTSKTKFDSPDQYKAIEGQLLTRSEKIIQRHKQMRGQDASGS